MKLKLKIIFYSYILFILIVMLLNLNANITFGKGLGDIYYLIILFVLSVGYSIFYFKSFNKKNEKQKGKILFCSVLLATILLVILKLTILRGAEYTWNGKLFLE